MFLGNSRARSLAVLAVEAGLGAAEAATGAAAMAEAQTETPAAVTTARAPMRREGGREEEAGGASGGSHRRHAHCTPQPARTHATPLHGTAYMYQSAALMRMPPMTPSPALRSARYLSTLASTSRCGKLSWSARRAKLRLRNRSLMDPYKRSWASSCTSSPDSSVDDEPPFLTRSLSLWLASRRSVRLARR